MTLARLVEFAGQNPLLSLAFVGLTLALVLTEIARLMRPYKGIGPAELTDRINRDDALVVDLRAIAEFEKGHIVGSRHLLLSQFDPEHKLLAKARETPVVLVDSAGMGVAAAAARLVKAGFRQVAVLDGGIAAWQQAGLPLAKGRDRA